MYELDRIISDHLFYSQLMLPVSEVPNFDIFRDSLATLLLQCLGPASTSGAGKEAGKKRSSKGRKNEIKPVSREPKMEDDGKGAELSEFVEVS